MSSDYEDAFDAGSEEPTANPYKTNPRMEQLAELVGSLPISAHDVPRGEPIALPAAAMELLTQLMGEHASQEPSTQARGNMLMAALESKTELRLDQRFHAKCMESVGEKMDYGMNRFFEK